MKPSYEDKLSELYQTYGAMVYRRCLKLLKNEQDALDCMQDVFMIILKSAIPVQYPSSYLYRAATNLSLNRIRDSKTHNESSIDPLVATIADYEETDHTIVNRLYIDKIFKGHSESTRVIALLHLYDGYTLEEVAQMVKMSVSGVRKRLRGLQESALKRGLRYE